MAESHLWGKLHQQMKFHGHFERIENMVGSGMPDVTYCVRGVEGFIELKQIKTWPARPDTVVELDHYSPQQRIWARRRLSAGGRVYLLLQVLRPACEYLLFDSRWAREHLGVTATQADCKAKALVYGVRKFPTDTLLDALTRARPAT